MKPGFILSIRLAEMIEPLIQRGVTPPAKKSAQCSRNPPDSTGGHLDYRPPPAQAQAQPAQAQAQAQEDPPPPPLHPPPLDEAEEGLGMGLVLFVMRLVKSVILPTTSLEKFEIPFTIEVANSAPGSTGTLGPLDLPALGIFMLGPAGRVAEVPGL